MKNRKFLDTQQSLVASVFKKSSTTAQSVSSVITIYLLTSLPLLNLQPTSYSAYLYLSSHDAMMQPDIPHAVPAIPNKTLVEKVMQKSMDSLNASLKSLDISDAAYWNTRKELAEIELVCKKIQLKEDKAEHLEDGGSLSDSTWRRRLQLYETEEDSIQRTINAAREEPSIS